MTLNRRPILQAPGAEPGEVARMPGRDEVLPKVDDRLVAPESRFEAVDGVLVETMGANEPHATANSELIYVLRAAVVPAFRCAVDMLTRADRYSDVAPDASIFAAERDASGGRQLEQLVFEVRDTQALSEVTRKAELLAARGVRRIFCLEVPSGNVREWKEGDWKDLAPGSVIDDPVFARPLPIAALASAAEADNSAASALLAKRNPVLEQALAENREQGRNEGLAPFVELVKQRLGRVLAEDEHRALVLRLARLGPARLASVVLERDAHALSVWLSDPDAS